MVALDIIETLFLYNNIRGLSLKLISRFEKKHKDLMKIFLMNQWSNKGLTVFASGVQSSGSVLNSV